MSWKVHIVRFLLIALGIAYAVIGLAFFVTFTPGGIAVGLGFLGGTALLYGGAKLLRQLTEVAALLRVLTYRKKTEAPHEGLAVEAGANSRSAEPTSAWLRDA